MSWDVILQALVVSGITAIVTSIVNGKVTAAHMEDVKARVKRIEDHLNGLLKKL